MHAREIRSEHIALAVLRADDEAVRMLLAHASASTPRALRADLEGRGRRTRLSGQRPGFAQARRRSASQVVTIRSAGTPSRSARSQP